MAKTKFMLRKLDARVLFPGSTFSSIQELLLNQFLKDIQWGIIKKKIESYPGGYYQGILAFTAEIYSAIAKEGMERMCFKLLEQLELSFPEVLDDGYYHNYSGNIFRKLKMYPKALECYNLAIAIRGSIAVFYYNRAELKADINDLTYIDDMQIGDDILAAEEYKKQWQKL